MLVLADSRQSMLALRAMAGKPGEVKMRMVLIWIFLLLSCLPSLAANEEFPQQVRGLWADTKETCDILKTGSPVDPHRDQRWVKLIGNDVFGTTQARFLREKKIPAQMAGYEPVRFLFEIQTANDLGLIVELSFKGERDDLHLWETILGAQASRIYSRC